MVPGDVREEGVLGAVLLGAVGALVALGARVAVLHVRSEDVLVGAHTAAHGAAHGGAAGEAAPGGANLGSPSGRLLLQAPLAGPPADGCGGRSHRGLALPSCCVGIVRRQCVARRGRPGTAAAADTYAAAGAASESRVFAR